jgi:outer membrane protein TolC
VWGICLVAVPATHAAEVTIAVVRDGPGPELDRVALIEAELGGHTPRGTTVRFKADSSFDAGWNPDAAATALQAALDDVEVEIVLAVGSMVTYAAAQSAGPLPKPVVSTFVQRSDVFKLPYSDEGESLAPNLNFVVIPQRAAADVQSFRELVPFDTLTVAVTAVELQNMSGLDEALKRYERELGVKFLIAPITEDVAASMSELASARAVYLTRLQRLGTEQRRQLIAELNRRKIPTFSMLGHSDVELGALAGETPDIESQLVRRVALNLGKLMRGRAAAELPVLLSVDTRLLVNARTAAAIGFVPGRQTRIFAEFLHPEELEVEAERLDFENLVSMAIGGSRSLRIADSEVEGFRVDQDRAKSALLPQVQAGVSYQHADTDLIADEQAAFGTIGVQQQIYDDGLWSSYKASTRIYESAELERETERLDVLADAGQAFYNLALAQAEYRIVAGDLGLTEDNLELAKLRREVGYSGREEVLRWQSVLAERRTSLFRAAETEESARIALNQVLGLEQDKRWSPEPPDIDPEVFPIFDGRFNDLFNDYTRLQQAKRAVVGVALDNAPELQAFDRSLDAQQIEVDRLKHRYTRPRFFADASYTDQLTSPEGPIFPEDTTLSVSVNAAYPLFEGGRRKADLGRARTDQETLSRRQQLAAELIEQRTRTAMQRCENSFPRIKFGLQAAETAGENLELVREQYAQGTVNVTDLLDAQNQKLTADQFANSAIYEFMGDLVELQRSIAWFESDHTAGERDVFVERVMSVIAEERP